MRTIKIGNIEKPDKTMIEEVANEILNCKITVLPTDTLYGLSALVREKCIERIFLIKKRSRRLPIPLFVDSIRMAERIAVIGPSERSLLGKVWPNPVSFVLTKRECVLDSLTSGLNTVMLRWPKSEFINLLVKKIGEPITTTSANISGRGALLDGSKIGFEFSNQKEKPDLLVDAGVISSSKIPSTIVDITLATPKLIRNGRISKSKLETLMDLKIDV